MKKNYAKLFSVLLAVAIQLQLVGQCATPIANGSASNMFTLIRNGNHAVVVDKTLDMVAFIHRNDVSLFGGNSGELRYDISTNAGATWTLNQGVLNPLTTNFARYPNIAFYNPPLNTNPSNVYVSYMAPTIGTASPVWNGIVTGVRQLTGTGTTETYNQNFIGTDQIPHSLVKGAPGVFWAIDPIGIINSNYNIYRGVWNSTLNDIVWNINYVATPPYTSAWTSAPQVVDYNIAFDPTGQIGYFSFMGHVTGGPSNNAIYPILYKTINGGTSWTGPIQVDLSKFGCISSNTVSGNNPSANVEHDLVVDVNGNPHIITTLGGANNYAFNYFAWHHMYDITIKDGLWAAYDLGNVNGSPNTFGISPDIAVQWQAPQAARTADGTKVFFTWTDNANYTLGQSNSLPNLFGKAYNVTTNNWTQTKSFTACNSNIAGAILFPHLAAEVLEPSINNYKLAVVIGVPTVSNNLLQQANFSFLDNVTFSSSEFTIAPPTATVNIAQAPNIIFCPNSTVNVNVVGAGQVLWSNGSTLIPTPITTGSINTYSVIAQVGCNVGTASISVTTLTFTAGALSPSICPGSSANFTVNGNGINYTWMPGSISGTNVALNPSVGTVTVNAQGSSSCIVSNTIPITILPIPTLSIAGNNTVCVGEITTLTVSGAQNYLWSDASNGSTYTSVATSNTLVAVSGTAANTCTNSTSVNIVVNPTLALTASTTNSAVCIGQVVTLLSSGGATSYSWNGVAAAQNYSDAPTATTIYTVSASNNFNCVTSKTISVIVYPLPTLTVSVSKSSVCKGDRVTLTASGANTYTWVTNGIIGSSVSVTAFNAQTYTYVINLMSAEGCTNTGTYSLTALACTDISETDLKSRIQIYPNPVNDVFIIKSDYDMEFVMTDELGKHVKNITVKKDYAMNFDVADLSAGVYFLSGRHQGAVIHQKIVVEK